MILSRAFSPNWQSFFKRRDKRHRTLGNFARLIAKMFLVQMVLDRVLEWHRRFRSHEDVSDSQLHAVWELLERAADPELQRCMQVRWISLEAPPTSSHSVLFHRKFLLA